MIERAIENWLTNTTERYYQTPFCQVLLSEGHRLIYRSTHGQLEQGKDIITIAPDGEYFAYQLKTGDINLAEWRKIRGELQELIELPIVHPEVDKSRVHKSFLVTNGEIKDPVRLQIDQINEDNVRKGRNYSHLSVITLPDLLKYFVDTQGKFIPSELKDFHQFLRFFTSDGRECIDKDLLFNFLNRSFFEEEPKRPSDAFNVVSSSVILTSYLLNRYQISENHFSIFEAWVILGACILRYIIRYNVEEELTSYCSQLVMSEIVNNLKNLKEETFARPDYLEGDLLGDGGLVYRFRKTLVLGCLSALELHIHDYTEGYMIDYRIVQRIKEGFPLEFSSEVFFPYIFCIIKLLELASEPSLALKLLHSVFTDIIRNNSHHRDFGFPSTYYSISDLLAAAYGLDTRKIDLSEFPGSSYTLEPMIHMLAKRNERSILEEWWRPLSDIALMSFKPDYDEDVFLWRSNTGVNWSKFPQAPQSWKDLCTLANDNSETPAFLTRYKAFLRFYILVCPHRANVMTLKVLGS